MSRNPFTASRITPFVALALLWCAAPASAQTTLRYKFHEGQSFDQQVVQDMKMSMQIGDQDINSAVKQTIDADWNIESVDDQGTAKITQQFTRLRMKMESAAGGLDFDSDKDEEFTGIGAQLAPSLKGLAKARFTMTLTAQGIVDNVEVSDETVAAMQALPGAAQLGGMFSKEGLVDMVKQSSHAFPDGELQKGGQWNKRSTVKLPQIGEMQADATLTYVGPEQVDGKTYERIDIDVITKIVPKEGGLDAQIDIKEQKTVGKIYFDNEVGQLGRSELVQAMTMEISVAGNKFVQKMDQTIKVTMTPAVK